MKNADIAATYAMEVTRYDDLIDRDMASLPEIVARSQAEDMGLTSDNLVGYWQDPETGEIDLITLNTESYWQDHPGVIWLDC